MNCMWGFNTLLYCNPTIPSHFSRKCLFYSLDFLGNMKLINLVYFVCPLGKGQKPIDRPLFVFLVEFSIGIKNSSSVKWKWTKAFPSFPTTSLIWKLKVVCTFREVQKWKFLCIFAKVGRNETFDFLKVKKAFMKITAHL